MSDYLGFFKVDQRKNAIWKDVDQMKKFISNLPIGHYMIKISTYDEKRTINQNKYYWKLVEIVSKELGYEVQEMHEVFKYKFLQTTIENQFGQLEKTLKSTTKLTSKEFTDYLNNIKFFVKQELNINLPENF